MAIKGLHALFYTTEPEAARAFLRDKLGLPAYDSGGGWLIFDLPEADIGCHPSDGPDHGISFYCDDIDASVAELEARGVVFAGPLREEEWGRVTSFELPGGGPVQLYQPKYAKP
jgi:catechol 2,3-dioxygenase-like lactoylglutathione lyase family enzyme